MKAFVEALISMPLVLPPTVLGFYILLVFSPAWGPGKFLSENLGLQLIFSFEGLVLASIFYSLPFMVQPLQSGFASISPSLREAGQVLGKTPWQIFFRIILPNIKSSLLAGIVLSFAHTLGEFGVVLMIGGSIPGETRVAAIAIYEEVEALNYANAHAYAIILVLLSFTTLLLVYGLRGKMALGKWK